MTNGRLASKIINSKKAEMVYKNTSQSSAAVSIQAATLSSTANTTMSLSIDTSTDYSFNYTVGYSTLPKAATTDLAAFDSTSMMFHNTGSTSWSSTNRGLRMAYANSSSVSTSPATSSTYQQHHLRIDPYYLTNPEEFGGKETASYITNNGSSTNYLHEDITNGGNRDLAATISRIYSTSSSGNSDSTSWNYYERGMVVDYYQTSAYNCAAIGWDNNAYMSFMTANTAVSGLSNQSNRTSDSCFYAISPSGYDSNSYSHPFYQGVAWFENGIYVSNPANNSNTYFYIGDALYSSGSRNSNVIYDGWGTGNRTYQFSSGIPAYPVCWMKYNPVAEKWYIAIKSTGIYEFDRTSLHTGSSSRNISDFNKVADMPNDQMSTPMRIDKSLWHSVDSSDEAWISTDLIEWTKASTYYESNYGAENVAASKLLTNGEHALAIVDSTDTGYTVSGYDAIPQDGTIEYKTTLSNYERTGLLLSSGDVIYAENSGAAPLAISIMGYEDE